MGILVTCWGIIMTCHGVVTNYAGIMVLRILLGVFEAGFFPGAVYLASFWYMPKDLAARISWFYCFSALSGAFSGMLAAAIAQMDGVGGYEGWRWIFILEGVVTVAVGVATFFIMVDTPSLSTKWLKPEEVRFLNLQHFVKQGGRFADETQEKRNIWHDLKAVLLNWRLWLLTWVQFCQSATAYGKSTPPSLRYRGPPPAVQKLNKYLQARSSLCLRSREPWVSRVQMLNSCPPLRTYSAPSPPSFSPRFPIASTGVCRLSLALSPQFAQASLLCLDSKETLRTSLVLPTSLFASPAWASTLLPLLSLPGWAIIPLRPRVGQSLCKFPLFGKKKIPFFSDIMSQDRQANTMKCD